ncbi:hypothetical protein MAH1_26050 [Sessilibacter sp. MAH1]
MNKNSYLETLLEVSNLENKKKIADAEKILEKLLNEHYQNWLVLLFCGYNKFLAKKLDEALIFFFSASELNEAVYTLWNDSRYDMRIRMRSRECSIALRNHFTNLHSNCVREFTDSNRILNSIWTRTHNQKYKFPNETRRPQLFYIPDLSDDTFFDPKTFNWYDSYQSIKDSLQEEYQSIKPLLQEMQHPYLDKNFYAPSGLENLTGSSDWSSVDLYKQGFKNKDLCNNLRQTFNFLDSVPTYNLKNGPEEIFLSRLKGNSSIPIHYGESNHSLTVHIPLEVHPQSGIVVV